MKENFVCAESRCGRECGMCEILEPVCWTKTANALKMSCFGPLTRCQAQSAT